MQTDTPNNTGELTGQEQQTGLQAETQISNSQTLPQTEQKTNPQSTPHNNNASNSEEVPLVKRKRKRHPVKSLLRILLALVVIAGGIFLILFVVAYLAKYDSIPAMLESMRVELSLMWQRIRN